MFFEFYVSNFDTLIHIKTFHLQVILAFDGIINIE